MFALGVVQIDEAGGDEAVDPTRTISQEPEARIARSNSPGAGICVQVDDEVVGRACRGCNENDHGDQPVKEELVRS